MFYSSYVGAVLIKTFSLAILHIALMIVAYIEYCLAIRTEWNKYSHTIVILS